LPVNGFTLFSFDPFFTGVFFIFVLSLALDLPYRATPTYVAYGMPNRTFCQLQSQRIDTKPLTIFRRPALRLVRSSELLNKSPSDCFFTTGWLGGYERREQRAERWARLILNTDRTQPGQTQKKGRYATRSSLVCNWVRLQPAKQRLEDHALVKLTGDGGE